MLRKNILLQTIENGFDARVQNYPIILNYAKEREAVNYKIYGNTTQFFMPSVDSPVVPQALGTNVGDNYFKIITTSENEENKSVEFFVPRDLYKVGNSVDYVDYKTQKAYFNTKIYNLKELISTYNLEIYSKQKDVVYASILYDGKPEEGCYSSIWEFNDGTDLNRESMGIDISSSKLFFSFSWSRLGLTYSNKMVYRMEDVENISLSDEEIAEIFRNFLLTLPQYDLNIIGANKTTEVEYVFMPSLPLHKGENKIILMVGESTTTTYKYLVTETGEIMTTEAEKALIVENIPKISRSVSTNEIEDYFTVSCLTTEYGEILLTEDGISFALEYANEGAPPSGFIIDYKSFMLL